MTASVTSHDFERALTDAYNAADDAVAGMVEDTKSFNCGFAWVTISGNDPLARHCRKMLKLTPGLRYGSKSYSGGGLPGWIRRAAQWSI